MTDEKKWKMLMKINEKAQYGINSLKSIYTDEAIAKDVRDVSMTFSATELYLIAGLTGGEATKLKRQMDMKKQIAESKPRLSVSHVNDNEEIPYC